MGGVQVGAGCGPGGGGFESRRSGLRSPCNRHVRSRARAADRLDREHGTRKASRVRSAGGVYLEAVLAPLEPEFDHVRGDPGGRVILEYGDYACPYSRKAFREVQRQLRGYPAELGLDIERF